MSNPMPMALRTGCHPLCQWHCHPHMQKAMLSHPIHITTYSLPNETTDRTPFVYT